MKNLVVIVDYGLCNLDSVKRAVEECGATARVTDDPLELKDADRIILPGVGAFGDAMTNLQGRGLDHALADEVLDGNAPFLGICLGMQLLARVGFEGGEHKGLGWFDAQVERLAPSGTERVPHIGWNEVHPVAGSPLFDGVPEGSDFYFVHSYHVAADDRDVLARTPYCGSFVSALHRDLIFAVQFHPEKSQQHGFQILRNFLAL